MFIHLKKEKKKTHTPQDFLVKRKRGVPNYNLSAFALADNIIFIKYKSI